MSSGDVDGDFLVELERLDSSGLSDREIATALEERAEQSPVGSQAHSGFLDAAGDRWGYAGDTVRAEAAYRASIASGGDAGRYADSALVLLLLQDGREAEADGVLGTLRELARVDELSAPSYATIAEALEEAGRLKEALRWFTIPLRRVDPDELDADDLPLLGGRARVRRALDLPKDRFDLEHDRLVTER